jgi:precorrin-6B methylase 2
MIDFISTFVFIILIVVTAVQIHSLTKILKILNETTLKNEIHLMRIEKALEVMEKESIVTHK